MLFLRFEFCMSCVNFEVFLLVLGCLVRWTIWRRDGDCVCGDVCWMTEFRGSVVLGSAVVSTYGCVVKLKFDGC